MYDILLFGDSNTWGFDPATGLRYPYEERWTTVCARLLGERYHCIPAGMNGRTTAFDDPEKPLRNGCRELDHELQEHKPLDLVVIMLGTNDMKFTDAKGSAAGLEMLVGMVLSVNERFRTSSPVFMGDPSILIVSPVYLNESFRNERHSAQPPVGEAGNPGSVQTQVSGDANAAGVEGHGTDGGAAGADLAEFGPSTADYDDVAESRLLADYYREIADRHGLHFMDAAAFAEPSVTDGVHMSAEAHRAVGEAVAAMIREILP